MCPAQPSIVTVQLGQCGNQVGCELFRTLARECFSGDRGDAAHSAASVFFRELRGSKKKKNMHSDGVARDRVARSVLVDMEPKAIQQAAVRSLERRSPQSARGLDDGDWFQYSRGRAFHRQSGSGNNWAFGYRVHGPQSFDESVGDLVRRELECCDRFGGFLLLQSLAGGTGSGVGAYLTERLRDDYPDALMVNQVVWPYEDGEVIVQNYNALMSLSTLQHCSDAVVYFENDQLSLTCTRLLGIRSPSFSDMNRVIANNLCHVLLPCGRLDVSTGAVGRPVRTWADMIGHLCCHPSYKLLACKSIPHVAERSKAYHSFLWRGLAKHLHQMLLTNAKMEEGINWRLRIPAYRSPSLLPRMAADGGHGWDGGGEGYDSDEDEDDDDDDDGRGEGDGKGGGGGTMATDVASGEHRNMSINKSVANVIIARGANLKQAARRGLIFENPLLYAEWAPPPPVQLFGSPLRFNGMDKSIGMLSNSQSVIHPLNRVLHKASEMFHASAYLYQYTKYGIEKDRFVECLSQMEQVLLDYQSLS